MEEKPPLTEPQLGEAVIVPLVKAYRQKITSRRAQNKIMKGQEGVTVLRERERKREKKRKPTCLQNPQGFSHE